MTGARGVYNSSMVGLVEARGDESQPFWLSQTRSWQKLGVLILGSLYEESCYLGSILGAPGCWNWHVAITNYNRSFNNWGQSHFGAPYMRDPIMLGPS